MSDCSCAFGVNSFLKSYFVQFGIQYLIGGEVGRDINEFIKANIGKHARGDIMAVFSHLSSEGIIYSTSDENHYAKIC